MRERCWITAHVGGKVWWYWIEWIRKGESLIKTTGRSIMGELLYELWRKIYCTPWLSEEISQPKQYWLLYLKRAMMDTSEEEAATTRSDIYGIIWNHIPIYFPQESRMNTDQYSIRQYRHCTSYCQTNVKLSAPCKWNTPCRNPHVHWAHIIYHNALAPHAVVSHMVPSGYL